MGKNSIKKYPPYKILINALKHKQPYSMMAKSVQAMPDFDLSDNQPAFLRNGCAHRIQLRV